MAVEGDLVLVPMTNRKISNKVSTNVYLSLITAAAALGGLLFGYDTAVISGAIGFVQKHFSLGAAGAGWAASSALMGCVIGSALAGFRGDAIGRRAVLLVSAILFLVSAIGTALAQSLTGFVAFRLLAGSGVGAASMTSPLYIAEISPAAWRGRLVAVNQFAIVSGMLLIYFVNYTIALHGSEVWNENTGWRWMFASGILPSTLLLVLLFFVPETPRFLTVKGRHQEAALVLLRTGGDASSQEAGHAGSLKTAPVPRILGIAVALAILQQVTGVNVFLYYAPQIFSRVSRNTNSALLQTVLVGAVNLLFTAIAMATVDRLGRKPLMIVGALGMGCCLIAMGSAAMAENTGVWLLAFVLGYIACFALSVGPVTWIILTEIFPMSVRNQALGIATMALWLANFAVSQTFPMLDQSRVLAAKFHHGFPFFFYAIFCVIEVFFVWRLLPETKDRTLEEISISWRMRRDF